MAPDVAIGRARLEDAAAMAAVHVEVWRNAYPGMLPDHSLVGLSHRRLAGYYAAAIVRGRGVMVARTPEAAGDAAPGAGSSKVIGFSTASRCRPGQPAEGEVETLYVLDDWRERGIGRSLLQAAAKHLAARSCRSAFLWVLADNPSRWFYERLGGRAAMRSLTVVGGSSLQQVAMVWDRIEDLTGGRSAGRAKHE